MPLPDFIIIGAMKSGTSTLHSNLKLHPEIGMSKFKEPSYFNESYKSRDLAWYKSLFNSGKKINGESSPNYTKKDIYPGTAKRMHETLPDVKLIYLTRDPINRIISHLHHNMYRDRLKLKGFERELKSDSNFVLTSKYYYQLEEYLKYYTTEQMLFLTTEELKADLNKTLNKICDFFNVQNFNFDQLQKSRNKSSDKYLIKNYDRARNVLPKRLMKLYHWFFYSLNIKIDRPQFSDEIVDKLHEELDYDVNKFVETAGIDLTNWKNFH